MGLKCAFCGLSTVDKNSEDYIRYKNKNYHKKCGEQQQEKDSFYSYVCFALGLKAPGPRIYSQANSFIARYHYDYPGMEKALRYFYEVQKKTDNYKIEDKTIGIIPYVYEDAQRYYQTIEHKKAKAEQSKKEQKEQIVTVRLKGKEEKKPTYNIDEIE